MYSEKRDIFSVHISNEGKTQDLHFLSFLFRRDNRKKLEIQVANLHGVSFIG